MDPDKQPSDNEWNLEWDEMEWRFDSNTLLLQHACRPG